MEERTEENIENNNIEEPEGERKWTVYIHTVPKELSGYEYDKYYVGITSRKPQERWGTIGNGYKGQPYFYRAIQKYGWENILHEIVASHLTKKEACEMEMSLIRDFKTTHSNHGYNLTLGGEGASYEHEDISGKIFGYLKILNLSKEKGKKGERKWDCKCLRCGSFTTKYENVLKSNNTISCGCYGKECGGYNRITHNKSYTKIYRQYTDLKSKCYVQNSQNYKYYGYKGYTICNEWLNDFQSFYDWSLLNGYDETKILVTKNGEKEYSPTSSLWISKEEFNKNYKGKSLCKYIEYKGEIHSLREWSEILNINYGTLKSRLKKLSIKDAFEKELNYRETA